MIRQPVENVTYAMVTVAESGSVLLEATIMEDKALFHESLARVNVAESIQYLAGPACGQ